MDNTHKEDAGWDNSPILFSLACHFTRLESLLEQHAFSEPPLTPSGSQFFISLFPPLPCPNMPSLVHTGSSQLYTYLSHRNNPSLTFCGSLTFSHLAPGSITVCCITGPPCPHGDTATAPSARSAPRSSG